MARALATSEGPMGVRSPHEPGTRSRRSGGTVGWTIAARRARVHGTWAATATGGRSVTDDIALSSLLERARRLVEDLNMTTQGWQMPSERLMEDFALGEHRLVAREHEVVDVDPGGSRGRPRRMFSLYAPDDEGPAQQAPLAVLIEPDGPGRWRLLVAERNTRFARPG